LSNQMSCPYFDITLETFRSFFVYLSLEMEHGGLLSR